MGGNSGSTVELAELVGDIYDCAANPDLWPDTLGRVRDVGDFAYVTKHALATHRRPVGHR